MAECPHRAYPVEAKRSAERLKYMSHTFDARIVGITVDAVNKS